jgi:hypothetical protein
VTIAACFGAFIGLPARVPKHFGMNKHSTLRTSGPTSGIPRRAVNPSKKPPPG